jgi:hypothetical protein
MARRSTLNSVIDMVLLLGDPKEMAVYPELDQTFLTTKLFDLAQLLLVPV